MRLAPLSVETSGRVTGSRSEGASDFCPSGLKLLVLVLQLQEDDFWLLGGIDAPGAFH